MKMGLQGTRSPGVFLCKFSKKCCSIASPHRRCFCPLPSTRHALCCTEQTVVASKASVTGFRPAASRSLTVSVFDVYVGCADVLANVALFDDKEGQKVLEERAIHARGEQFEYRKGLPCPCCSSVKFAILASMIM